MGGGGEGTGPLCPPSPPASGCATAQLGDPLLILSTTVNRVPRLRDRSIAQLLSPEENNSFACVNFLH